MLVLAFHEQEGQLRRGHVSLPIPLSCWQQEELEYSGMFCVFFTVCVLANIFSHVSYALHVRELKVCISWDW